MNTFEPSYASRLLDERHVILRSPDRDEVIDVCSKALRPHNLALGRREEKTTTRLHHLPVGNFSLSRLLYGCDATITSVAPEESNFLMSLPVTGRARVQYGSDSFDVEPGRSAIVGPYETFRFAHDTSFDVCILRLDRSKVERVAAGLAGDEEPRRVHFKLGMDRFPPLLHSLLDAATHLAIPSDTAAHSRLLTHFEECLIESLLLAQPNSVLCDLQGACRPAPSHKVRRAIKYMREHIHEPLRISEVARHCAISVRGLQAGFSRELGASPAQWLRDQRLEGVYGSLKQAECGSTSVSQVAYQWGFSNLGDFAAHFRARFGLKPSEVLAKRR